MKWNFRNVVFLLSLLAFCTPAFSSNNHSIYGFEKACSFHSTTNHGNYSIQSGAFLNKVKADNNKKYLQSKTSYPVFISKKGKFNVVNVGSLHSEADVRNAASDVLSRSCGASIKVTAKPAYQTPHKNYKPLAMQTTPLYPRSNWFVGLNVGLQEPQQFNSNMTVNNGSGFPAPFNSDIYFTNNKTAATIAVMGGYRWERQSPWLSAASLGLQYQNILASNAGDTIEQYSTPTFNNYTYSDYISSNVVLAFAKINLVRIRAVSPYFKAGIGCAFNRSSDYNEAATANVTPRISPSYSSNTRSQLAFNVGAGFDFQLDHQLIATVGYDYLDLGHVSSGTGTNQWSGQSLNFGSYHTNEVFLGLNYLFGAGK